MIKRDILEKQAKIVYLGIGSNLGNKIRNIENAKIELVKNEIKILNCSSYYETLSWPNPNFPKFYNLVLKVKTKISKIRLLKLCKNIEKSLGRKKSKKNSPRICDIDIIDYDRQKCEIHPKLPHPRMHMRNFVLIPLFEVDNDWKHPITNQHIKKLIFSLSNRDIRSIKQI